MYVCMYITDCVAAMQDENGQLNFDVSAVVNPLTGEKVGSLADCNTHLLPHVMCLPICLFAAGKQLVFCQRNVGQQVQLRGILL